MTVKTKIVDKVIIDENIENTFAALNSSPSAFRIKDYARNLPDDYADDFAYALFEASLTYNAKATLTKLVLRDCTDESVGTNIENTRFNDLYNAAISANLECKNGYLPLFFSYIELIAENPGISNSENKELIAKFLNMINNDKEGFFPDKLYQKDEYSSSIGLDRPVPSESFLSQVKNYYKNLILDPTASKFFDRQKIDTILNQYLDDIYSLTYEDEKKSLSFFERSDKVLTIESCDQNDRKSEILGNSQKLGYENLYQKLLTGLVSNPLCVNGKYDFSYFSSAANILAENIEVFLNAFNAENKEKLMMPEPNISQNKKSEFAHSCKAFIASYMTALISQKYNLENEQNDPDKLLDPNLKINLLKNNENLFTIALSEGKSEIETTQNVQKLISIAKNLTSFLEKEKDKQKDTLNHENEAQFDSNSLIKYILGYLKDQEKVYVNVMKKLYAIQGRKANNLNYTKDIQMIIQYAAIYAPEKDPKSLAIEDLIEIIDRQADKFQIALNTLKSRSFTKNLSACIDLYNTPNIPAPIKRQEVAFMDRMIKTALVGNRCKDEKIIQAFIKIFHETLKTIPVLKQKMQTKLTEKNLSQLKSNQAYKSLSTFKNVIATTLYMDKESNQTTYNFVEGMLPKKSLSLEQKYIVKYYVKDAIIDVALLLSSGDCPTQIIAKLENIANKFDDQNSNTLISAGLISQSDREIVIKELKQIYSEIPGNIKENPEFAKIVNLIDLIPSLIKRIPASKTSATSNFVDFIFEIAGNDNRLLIKEELLKELKKIAPDDKNDPYRLKEKYQKLVPAEQIEIFEELWKALPRVNAKSRDKQIFEKAFKEIISRLNKKEQQEYLTYYKQLFAPASRKYVAQSEFEKTQIEIYLNLAKNKILNLFIENQITEDYETTQLINILETYSNTKVQIEKVSDDKSSHTDEENV